MASAGSCYETVTALLALAELKEGCMHYKKGGGGIGPPLSLRRM